MSNTEMVFSLSAVAFISVGIIVAIVLSAKTHDLKRQKFISKFCEKFACVGYHGRMPVMLHLLNVIYYDVDYSSRHFSLEGLRESLNRKTVPAISFTKDDDAFLGEFLQDLMSQKLLTVCDYGIFLVTDEGYRAMRYVNTLLGAAAFSRREIIVRNEAQLKPA